ncbi:hypothetical protein RRG08_013161 [Elysia crispata]|uniref:Uncharacterized protein n=1 Tax=Elysia crispata TaxID=231223 RepID=A0AAE1A073_9GAST|nr:hypothetical protein RRG08_013161 [Elysia crispata]
MTDSSRSDHNLTSRLNCYSIYVTNIPWRLTCLSIRQSVMVSNQLAGVSNLQSRSKSLFTREREVWEEAYNTVTGCDRRA